jgi:hypothetical protein
MANVEPATLSELVRGYAFARRGLMTMTRQAGMSN